MLMFRWEHLKGGISHCLPQVWITHSPLVEGPRYACIIRGLWCDGLWPLVRHDHSLCQHGRASHTHQKGWTLSSLCMNVLILPLGCRGRFTRSQIFKGEHWPDEKHYPILQDLHLIFLFPYLAQNSACSFSGECTLPLHLDVSLHIISKAPSCFGNGQLFDSLTINMPVYLVVFALYEQICKGKPHGDFSSNFLVQHFGENSELKWVPEVEYQHLNLPNPCFLFEILQEPLQSQFLKVTENL